MSRTRKPGYIKTVSCPLSWTFSNTQQPGLRNADRLVLAEKITQGRRDTGKMKKRLMAKMATPKMRKTVTAISTPSRAPILQCLDTE
jgi:hypothetical protein